MKFIKSLFGSLTNRFLVRAYLFSLALFIYSIWYFSSRPGLHGFQQWFFYFYAALSAILFPFAKLVWDEIRNLVLGNTSFVVFDGWAIVVTVVFKTIINIFLWFSSIAIAPLGILYLWLINRKTV